MFSLKLAHIINHGIDFLYLLLYQGFVINIILTLL